MQWLTKILGEQAIPQFEVNTRTVDILYQLAEASENRCTEVSLLAEDYTQKAAEYQAEACQLQEVLLKGVGLSPGSLSKPASEYLDVLVGSAMVLKVKDTSLSSFVPALNGLTNELRDAQKRDRETERQLTNISRKLGSTLVLRKMLEEDLQKIKKTQEVENAKIEDRMLNMDFIKAKTRDISYKIKRAEEEMASRKMEPTLTHQAILDLSAEISKLKKEMIPLTKKLNSYKDLKPNPSLARVKIEEAKRELAAIDSELEMKVDIMNTTMHKQHGGALK